MFPSTVYILFVNKKIPKNDIWHICNCFCVMCWIFYEKGPKKVRTKRQQQQNVCISSYFLSINANGVKVQP